MAFLAGGSNSSRPPVLSVKQTALAALIVSVIGGGLGALLATWQQPKNAPGAPSAHEGAAAMGLVELPPIVTNLASPQDMWIRLEASMVFDPKTTSHPEAEALRAEITNDVIAYLRTISLAQIQGASGLQSFRQILNERAAIRSNGKVNELVLRTLVVQ